MSGTKPSLKTRSQRRKVEEAQYRNFVPKCRSTEAFETVDENPVQVNIVNPKPVSDSTLQEISEILDTRKRAEKPKKDEQTTKEEEDKEGSASRESEEELEESGAESEGDKEESRAESEEDKEESDIETGEDKMSNVTLREALEKAKIPALPKFLAPPLFNPATSDPNSFIDTYERVALTNSWDDALKISYLPIILEKAALAWFRQYTTTQSNAEKTWRALTNDFLAEFGSGEFKRGVRAKFKNRKQGLNEDVKSYFFELLVLQQEWDPKMSDESFSLHFEN
ncbi:hypothetical protein Zmor_018220 [Zophobas morio]|uniref:Retrotransposon gag domain-containing protein n=1 Tax=Zophobas morio TaxID=2755281 RepID=A0AA38MDQ7_9CUCU|nr:hypothetical protein Zmor_018220 [Zophobas morio]